MTPKTKSETAVRVNYGMSLADVEKAVIDMIGFSDMEYPLDAVYVLKCDCQPDYSIERFYRAAKKRRVPNWAKEKPEESLYVGISSDVVGRLHEHINAEGAQFTALFPPKEIVEIRKKEKIELDRDNYRAKAMRKEAVVAEEYRSKGHQVSTGK